MYRIGYIDDEPTQFRNFKKKIARKCNDMELILIDDCKTKEEILDKIYEERIDVLLVDYKMVSRFGFNGTTLIHYINDHINDLQCFILTQVEQTQISDKIVALRDCYTKEVFDTEAGDENKEKKLMEFLMVLHDSAIVFTTRREQKVEKYKLLLEKKKNGVLGSEEEEFLDLYKILSSYGIVERLPRNMLNSDFENKLDELLSIGQGVIDKHRGV